jgi:hypothetical protein
MDNLNEKNFFHYAVSNLKSHYVSETEFKLLLKHIVYIKRLLKKYQVKEVDLNLNLLLNHFIILYNEFDISAMNHILFFQFETIYYSELKSILLFLDKIKGNEELKINGQILHLVDIAPDTKIIKEIKKQTSL